jgi:hypothetical protein
MRIGVQYLSAQLLGLFQPSLEALLLPLLQEPREIRLTGRCHPFDLTALFVFPPASAGAGIVPSGFHALLQVVVSVVPRSLAHNKKLRLPACENRQPRS